MKFKFTLAVCAVAAMAFCTSCAESASHDEANVSDFWSDNVTAEQCFAKQQALLDEYNTAVKDGKKEVADSINFYGSTLANKIDEKCKADENFKKAYEAAQQAVIGKDTAGAESTENAEKTE